VSEESQAGSPKTFSIPKNDNFEGLNFESSTSDAIPFDETNFYYREPSND
jgi:hypothetical protein